ncbi:MAG: hypothetical protein JNK34_06760 [Tabrizicola sp.]|nr:hypothetical protein [Tabrizicola sp.]
MRTLLALALALATPATAEMLDGADDPAFQSALTTLLSADDPAAVAALRDLAEAGNTAALVTLPFALEWVPPTGNLKEKNAQRMVGGVKAQDAAAEAYGATELWNRGQMDGTASLPDRATSLLTLGEPEKATYLLSAWLNQIGGRDDPDELLLSDNTPAMLAAIALSYRLIDATFVTQTADQEATHLLAMMQDDRLAGWVAYVQLMESNPEIFQTIGSPLAGTGLSAADTDARIAAASAVRAVSMMRFRGDTPITAETATLARETLQGRTELLPTTRLCQAHCPDSIASCEAAVLAYPGELFGSFEATQPFARTLDPLTFAASDRGLQALIPLRQDPAAAADRATAEGLDACYVGVLARRDSIHLGP